MRVMSFGACLWSSRAARHRGLRVRGRGSRLVSPESTKGLVRRCANQWQEINSWLSTCCPMYFYLQPCSWILPIPCLAFHAIKIYLSVFYYVYVFIPASHYLFYSFVNYFLILSFFTYLIHMSLFNFNNITELAMIFYYFI